MDAIITYLKDYFASTEYADLFEFILAFVELVKTL